MFLFVGYKYHLDSALVKPTQEIWLPEGCLHMTPFQFHLKGHWRYPQSVDSLLPWTETISAYLDWWQNPTNVMRGADVHPKDLISQLFTDASLRPNLYKGAVVRQGKKATHKCPRVEGGLSGPSKLQGPVSEPNRQLNSGNKEELSTDVCSPVEDHDMVSSLPDNIESQTHSRVSECDGRPFVQVEPSTVNRMVTASAGVPSDMSKVVHFSC